MTDLTAWQNFYVIVGSSAGALIGLQFVVMALIANMPDIRVQTLAGEAFVTPTSQLIPGTTLRPRGQS